MASYEVRGRYEVWSLDLCVTESEVRAGVTARFLRVIIEVTLAIFVCVVTDNLNGVLVGTYSTV